MAWPILSARSLCRLQPPRPPLGHPLHRLPPVRAQAICGSPWRFSDQDKDAFKHDAFDYIRRHIEGSLAELAARYSDIRGNFRSIDANRFTAVIYRDGKKVSACTVSMGGMLGDILYSSTENDSGNSCNESLSVEVDDQMLHLKSMGMSMMFSGRNRDEKLSMEGGAELFWSMLIEPLQRN